MKKIFATNDKNAFAIVDADVYEIIKEMELKFRNNKGYFLATIKIQLPGMTEKKRLYLHQFVYILKTGTEPTRTIDHQDRDKSNNQFENLRLATRQQQRHNQGRSKSNTSGYICVCHEHNVDKRYKNGYRDYWRAYIKKPDGKRENKYFRYTENGKQHAAMWYDMKAREYFGKFHGKLNFPMPSD